MHDMSAILKPSRLFPSCLQRKADWEKTSKMQPVSTPSFKKESDLGECERATTHKRLFWNINTLTLSFSLNLRPQHSQQTLIHTKCYLEVSMDAHARLLGFIWGLKWATDQNWCWNLAQHWCTDLNITEPLSRGDAKDTAAWPDLFLHSLI